MKTSGCGLNNKHHCFAVYVSHLVSNHYHCWSAWLVRSWTIVYVLSLQSSASNFKCTKIYSNCLCKQSKPNQAAAAELIAMTLFVIIGCGSACANGASNPSNRLQVALAFGMGILVLAYSVGHHSGGQINCAVTLSLVLGGQVPWYQGLVNLIAQLIGSLLGAGLLCAVFPCEVDETKTVGTNIIDTRWGVGNVLVGEFLGTFLLCFVVWETAVSPVASCGKNACIAIGFAVFLAHVILLPVDGCSINPTRSFGPAIVGAIRNCEGMSTKGLEETLAQPINPISRKPVFKIFMFFFRFRISKRYIQIKGPRLRTCRTCILVKVWCEATVPVVRFGLSKLPWIQVPNGQCCWFFFPNWRMNTLIKTKCPHFSAPG